MRNQLSSITRNKLNKYLENEIDMALKRRATRIIELLNPQKKEKILEAGCSWGFYLTLINKVFRDVHLYGVDIDEKSLFFAKRDLKATGIKILKSDLQKKLPFRNNFFDKIIISEVAEHLTDDKKAFQQLLRVLKPGGTLIVTVPNKNYPLFWDPVNWLMERFADKHVKCGFWAGIWNDHKRLYTKDSLKKLLQQAGFKVLVVEDMTWWCLPFNHNLLYGGKLNFLPESIRVRVREQYQKKSLFKKLGLKLINFNDKLNDLKLFPNTGVGIIIKAEK